MRVRQWLRLKWLALHLHFVFFPRACEQIVWLLHTYGEELQETGSKGISVCKCVSRHEAWRENGEGCQGDAKEVLIKGEGDGYTREGTRWRTTVRSGVEALSKLREHFNNLFYMKGSKG